MTIVRFCLSVFLLLASISTLAQTPSGDQEKARAVLQEAAISKDPAVRVQAVEAIGLIGINDDVRTQLEGFLDDKDVDVRIAAIKTIANHNFQASSHALETILKTDKVPEVQFAAARALDTLKDPAGRTWLIDVYDGSEKATSGLLSDQSRKFFDNFHTLDSTGTFLMTQGVGYLPVPGVGAAYSAITDLISDPDLSPRATVLLLVSRDEDPRVDQLLKGALEDKDWSVRATAAQMVAFTNRRDLREDLVPLFEDKNEKVRLRAAGAYLHFALSSQSVALPFDAANLGR